jgi:hypothetical protein
LKPEKVEDLCRQIVAVLKSDARVKMSVPGEQVELAIRKILLDDLQREDELMQEVDRIMASHRGQIAGKNIDVQIMRRKIRDQLVRQRKIVL